MRGVKQVVGNLDGVVPIARLARCGSEVQREEALAGGAVGIADRPAGDRDHAADLGGEGLLVPLRTRGRGDELVGGGAGVGQVGGVARGFVHAQEEDADASRARVEAAAAEDHDVGGEAVLARREHVPVLAVLGHVLVAPDPGRRLLGCPQVVRHAVTPEHLWGLRAVSDRLRHGMLPPAVDRLGLLVRLRCRPALCQQARLACLFSAGRTALPVCFSPAGLPCLSAFHRQTYFLFLL